MNPGSNAHRTAEVVDEVSKWTVGAGIVIVALFPLALPFLLLTAVALVPLLVPLLAVGLIAALVGLPIMLARRLLRAVRRPPRDAAPKPDRSRPTSGARA